MPSHTRYRPPTHFITVSQVSDACSSAPMPNIDSAITTTNPHAPPSTVYSALRQRQQAVGPGRQRQADRGQQVDEPSVQVHGAMLAAVAVPVKGLLRRKGWDPRASGCSSERALPARPLAIAGAPERGNHRLV